MTNESKSPKQLNNTSKVRQPVERAVLPDIRRAHPCDLYNIVSRRSSISIFKTCNMNALLLLFCTGVVASVSAARLDHLTGFGGGNSYSAAPSRFENVNNGDGTYRFSFDTPTGISAHESGAPRAAGPEGAAVTAEGGFSYRAPDGQQISLTYTADENGFHPVGAHIPTPPPIPEAILRSLEYNRQHPSSDNGAYNAGRNYRY